MSRGKRTVFGKKTIPVGDETYVLVKSKKGKDTWDKLIRKAFIDRDSSLWRK